MIEPVILECACVSILSLTGRLPVRTKLTPSFVLNAVAETGADRTLFWDETLPGFGLMVTKGGHRSYVYQYRAGGRSRRMSFPITLGLDKARREARKAVGGVAGGGDPLAERRKAEAAAENTFQSICEEYFRRDGKRLRSSERSKGDLERLVYPKLGARQIDTILRSEIVRLLDKIEDEHGPAMSDRILADVRKIMNWHAARSDDFRSPITRGMSRTKPKQRARKRTLADDEIRDVWVGLKAVTEPACYARFVKSLLLCATRRTESGRMHTRELDGDLWTIPGGRYKTKLDHVIPLSPMARDLVGGKPPAVKANSWFVFSTSPEGKTAFSGYSKAKKKLDEAIASIRKREKRDPMPSWRLHDLRRTARTLMTRAKVPAEYAERCLGHVVAGVEGVYNRYEYLEEKRAAFEALASLVHQILNPKDNVVPMRSKEIPA
jgi:integrase